jgi:D-alanine-D-alanine ligase
MGAGASGFIPVLHAATESRPDEIDTLTAAQSVAVALQELGYDTGIVALGLDLAALDALARQRPLLVFNLVDAIAGDGRLAPMVPVRLEALGMPFTGCGSRSWFETLSKTATKLKLAQAGLPTPGWSEDGSGLDRDVRVIVKPDWEHGSLGIDDGSIVRGSEAAQAIAERTARWQTEHFAESYVEGREFNVALLRGPSGVEVLPIAEIVFADEIKSPRIVGYDAKWETDSAAYIGTPRRFGLEREEPELALRLADLSRACWGLFGVDGYARVDFRVDSDARPFILEVNMNPCLSPDAGFPASASESGRSYRDMIQTLVEGSLKRLRATA